MRVLCLSQWMENPSPNCFICRCLASAWDGGQHPTLPTRNRLSTSVKWRYSWAMQRSIAKQGSGIHSLKQSSGIESRQGLLAHQFCSRFWDLRSMEPVFYLLCPFQGQGPWTEGMWLLHWQHQPVHPGHRAGLAGRCQPELGHEGRHLRGGMQGSVASSEASGSTEESQHQALGMGEWHQHVFDQELHHWATFPWNQPGKFLEGVGQMLSREWWFDEGTHVLRGWKVQIWLKFGGKWSLSGKSASVGGVTIFSRADLSV